MARKARSDKGSTRKYVRSLDKHIGTRLLDIKVDENAEYLSEEEVEHQYHKYGIHRYNTPKEFVLKYFNTTTGEELLDAWGYRKQSSKEDVFKHMAEDVRRRVGLREGEEDARKEYEARIRIENFGVDDLASWIVRNNPYAKRLWDEYSHRDELISTGQYETARNRQYVDNLLKKYDMALSYSEFSTHLDKQTLAKVRALRDTMRNMSDDEIVRFLDASKDKGVDNARASRLPYIIDSDPRTINEGNDEMDNIIQVLKDAGITTEQEQLDVEGVYGRKKESVEKRRRAYKGDYERAFEILSYRMPPTIYKPSHTYSDKELLRWGDAMPRTRDGRVAFFPKSLNDRYFELKNRE